MGIMRTFNCVPTKQRLHPNLDTSVVHVGDSLHVPVEWFGFYASVDQLIRPDTAGVKGDGLTGSVHSATGNNSITGTVIVNY